MILATMGRLSKIMQTPVKQPVKHFLKQYSLDLKINYLNLQTGFLLIYVI